MGAKLIDKQTELGKWAGWDFGLVVKRAADIRKCLGKIWNSPQAPGQQEVVNNWSKELYELLLREELLWTQ